MAVEEVMDSGKEFAEVVVYPGRDFGEGRGPERFDVEFVLLNWCVGGVRCGKKDFALEVSLKSGCGSGGVISGVRRRTNEFESQA